MGKPGDGPRPRYDLGYIYIYMVFVKEITINLLVELVRGFVSRRVSF